MAKPRLLIIGLDGGTYKIIDPLIKEKKLPHLERLINEGTKAILKSTIPPLTPAAWVTFMTGKNPGKLGFAHFASRQKGSYKFNEICAFHDINYPSNTGQTITAISLSNWYGCGYHLDQRYDNDTIKAAIGGSILIFN